MRDWHLGRAVIVAVVLALGERAAEPASGDVVYQVTPLGTVGGNPSYAYATNAAGDVVGYSDVAAGKTRASLSGDKGAGVADLGTLTGAGISYGHGVNASGEVAGTSSAAGGSMHAFLTGAGGAGMNDLGTLRGGGVSFGFAVNDAAQVTGYSTVMVGGSLQIHAFVTGPGGAGMADLGTLGAGTASAGYAVNASGQVAGYSYLAGATGDYHAFLTASGGPMKDLGTLQGDVDSIGQAVNASGQVAGVSAAAGGHYRAFLTDASGGTMHDLGALTPGGDSYAYGLNDQGQVVGYATTASGKDDAFLYSNGRMVDLNALIPDLPGVHLTNALAITDNGLILAQGTDVLGLNNAYLLAMSDSFVESTHPVPEPPSLAALALGLAGLAAWRCPRGRARFLGFARPPTPALPLKGGGGRRGFPLKGEGVGMVPSPLVGEG